MEAKEEFQKFTVFSFKDRLKVFKTTASIKSPTPIHNRVEEAAKTVRRPFKKSQLFERSSQGSLSTKLFSRKSSSLGNPCQLLKFSESNTLTRRENFFKGKLESPRKTVKISDLVNEKVFSSRNPKEPLSERNSLIETPSLSQLKFKDLRYKVAKPEPNDTSTSESVFLPVLRTKPARNISESHQHFKQGIYKKLYYPVVFKATRPGTPIISKEKSHLEFYQVPNVQVAVSPYSERVIDESQPKSARSPLISSIKNVSVLTKEVKTKPPDILDSVKNDTAVKLANEVLEVLNGQVFRDIFEESEKKMIKNSMDSFRGICPQLYTWLLEDLTSKGERGTSIRKELKEYLKKLASMKLSTEEVIQEKVFTMAPFERKGSYAFFTAIKEENVALFREIVRDNRYLVFDVDYAKMTPLHWAAKKNNNFMCEKLMNLGADISAKDCLGRYPLYFAVKNKNVDLVRQFLLLQASPWSSPATMPYEELCDHDGRIKNYIQKARMLHIIMQISPVKFRGQIWATEAPLYFGSRKIIGNNLN